MATPTPQPPAGLLEAIQQAASEVLPARMNTLRESTVGGEGGATAEDAVFAAPRPLYNLGLDRILDGSGLAAADHVGWRTLVTIGRRPVAAVDAAADTPTVSSFNYGPFVKGLAQATDASRAAINGRNDPAASAGAANADERVLQVPALYFVGLWIHDAENSANDVIVPAAPAPPGLQADERYPADDVVSKLATLAEGRLADDHGERNPEGGNA
jgi:hypothetical protein